MPNAGCVQAGSPNEIVVLTADTGNQSSTTEAIISPQLTVLAYTCQIGTTFQFEFVTSCAAGATAQTTPGIVYQLRWGGVGGTVICNANNIITPATSLAATPGLVRGGITIRTIGASGTAKGWLQVIDPRIVREATTGGIYERIGKSGSAVTIDTTADKVLCVTSKGTVSDASLITFGESGFMQMVRV